MRSDSALTLSSRSFRSFARASSSTFVTIDAAKYRTFSSSRGAMSSRYPMRDGRGQVDVTHALAPHLLARDLDAAALADDALVADALVLAAVALPVLRRTEDALAEQAVSLGLERAVVDRLRLRYLAGRPVANLLRRREPDADRVEIIDVDQAFSFFSLALDG